jgi:hypothetical protein
MPYYSFYFSTAIVIQRIPKSALCYIFLYLVLHFSNTTIDFVLVVSFSHIFEQYMHFFNSLYVKVSIWEFDENGFQVLKILDKKILIEKIAKQ